MAVMNTAPAAISFMWPMRLWNSGWIKSAMASQVVFNPSAAMIRPMDKVCAIHSVFVISK